MADRDAKIERPRIVIEGARAERAQQLVDRGNYESLDEVAEAAFDAFEREHEAANADLRKLVQEADDDPGHWLPLDEAFAEIRRNIQAKRAS